MEYITESRGCQSGFNAGSGPGRCQCGPSRVCHMGQRKRSTLPRAIYGSAPGWVAVPPRPLHTAIQSSWLMYVQVERNPDRQRGCRPRLETKTTAPMKASEAVAGPMGSHTLAYLAVKSARAMAVVPVPVSTQPRLKGEAYAWHRYRRHKAEERWALSRRQSPPQWSCRVKRSPGSDAASMPHWSKRREEE